MNVVRIGIGVAFLADVAMKMWTRQLPADAGRFAFWPSVGPIGIVPSVNDVLAFSLPVPNVVIWPVGWVVVVWLIARLLRNVKCRTQNAKLTIAFIAIVLGAVSNLMDRTFLGGVTDYLSFTNLFPAFNIADLLILGGLAGWIMSERRRTHDRASGEPQI
ncbi:MAG: signal peptidase II [bacterium]|nr:signal peptidase II [bacterium]